MKAIKATLLVAKNEYPIPVSFDDQEQLLSRITKQRKKEYHTVLVEELDEIQKNCSVADIDFEFVLDSSGSIGSWNWETTTDLIAKHWIEEIIQPLGSPKCGNHVGIRRYSTSHVFDLNFTPTNDWKSNGFANYTEAGFQVKCRLSLFLFISSYARYLM